MVTRRGFAALVLALGVAGCSSAPDTAGLPDGGQLLRESAEAVKQVTSAHFTLKVTGTVPAIPVQEAEGDLTRQGSAKGTVKLTLMGSLFDGEFVLVDDALYIKGPTGGFQKLPSMIGTSVYDPSAILDPERGVAKILTSLRDPVSQAREDVGGGSAVKVTGKAEQADVAAVVPGVSGQVDVTVWVREDSKQPVKASVALPGDGGPATVDLTLSDVDKPVVVTPPA